MKSTTIQTSFESKEALIEALSKHTGRSKIFYNYKTQLWAEIKPDDTVTLTCDGKNLASFEFIGTIIESDGRIELNGHVKKREDIIKRQNISSVMMLIMAIVMFSTKNVVFIFMGILFLLVTLLNRVLFKNELPFIKYLTKTLSDRR